MQNNNTLQRLAIAHAPALGPQQFLAICAETSDFSAWLQNKSFRRPSLYLAPQTCAYLENIPNQLFKAVETWQSHPQNNLLFIDDLDYPPLLKNIADPPLVLYVSGDKSHLANWQLAMVGSRHPTKLGLQTAHDWAAIFAKLGITICSGLAHGIDGASHRGALSSLGKTIAVLGSGLQNLYPVRHTTLAKTIIENNGTVISEFPLSTPPLAFHFPRRNRIISGLSQGILVIEAALKSGSLITAYLGLEQGREIIAVPGALDNPQSAGCHALIRDGAALVSTPAEVLAIWPEKFGQNPIQPTAASTPKNALAIPLPTDPQAQLLWQTAKSLPHPWSIDTLVSQTGLTTSTICSMLCTFEISGLIASVPGGYRCC